MMFCLTTFVDVSSGYSLLPMFLILAFVAISKGLAEHPMEKTARCRILGKGLIGALVLFLVIFEVNTIMGKEVAQLTLVPPLAFFFIFILFTIFLVLGYLEIKSKKHLMTEEEQRLSLAFMRIGILAHLLGLIVNITMFS